MDTTKIQFEKRELMLTLWHWARVKSREDYFFELVQELAMIEENQQ